MAGGDGVAHGAVVAVQSAVEQSGPEAGGVRVLAQDLAGFGGAGRVGNPLQNMLDRASGERGGVEERLDDLGSLGGVEPRSRIALPGGDGGADRAGGERLRPTLRQQRVDAADDRVPHQFGQAGCETERVEHNTRSAVRCAGRQRQQQVVGLGQCHERSSGRGQQGGDEQVEGLAGALRADDAGGAVPPAPQFAGSAGFLGVADRPTDLTGIAPVHCFAFLPYRSGRITFPAVYSRWRPRSRRASSTLATPSVRFGPQR